MKSLESFARFSGRSAGRSPVEMAMSPQVCVGLDGPGAAPHGGQVLPRHGGNESTVVGPFSTKSHSSARSVRQSTGKLSD